MPRTRASLASENSTTKKAKPNSLPGVPKPLREQTAKVVKNPRVKKGKGTSGENPTPRLSVGSRVPLSDDFGGEIYLHDGTKTSLKQLVDKSTNGVIVYTYPKSLDDDAFDLYAEFEHAQLDWESAEMDTIGISPDSVSSTAAFVKEKDIRLPLASNPNGSLMKTMSITSPKGNISQGAFILSKTGVLLVRTIGKTEKIMDDLCKVLFAMVEEENEESEE